MSNVANARINTFGKPPRADTVSPDDPILEIPLSEFQHILEDLVSVYNQMAEVVKISGILRGKELARLTEEHTRSLKAERSPITKILLLNAFLKQFLTKIRDHLKTRPSEGGKIIQVVSKVMARAVQIVDYIKTVALDSPRKEIALDSQQARILFQGAGSEPVSRKETIRAMRRAEALWPALQCNHRANDGRRTMRLTGIVEDLKDVPIMEYSDSWQRSGSRVATSSL